MRLPAIQTSAKQFCLLQLDLVPRLAEALRLSWQEPEQRQLSAQVAESLMEILSKEVSGVVVSPEYTFESILKKDHQTGLLLSLERQLGAVDPFALPTLIENWGVEHVRNNYALAKLELFYHPAEPEAIRKKQLVAEVHHYCQLLGIDFLLELRLFPPSESENTRENLQEAQILALEDMRTSCDIVALEYPADALTAVTITAELDIPWVSTGRTFRLPGESTAASSYATFKEHLRAALESGARGYLIDAVLWEESFSEVPSYTTDQQQDWMEMVRQAIQTTIRDRVVELTRIVDEAVSPDA